MAEEQHNKELRRLSRNLRRLLGLDSRVFQALYGVVALLALAVVFLAWDAVPQGHLGASQRYVSMAAKSSLRHHYHRHHL